MARILTLALLVLAALAAPAAAARLPEAIDARIALAARTPNPAAVSAAVIESISERPDLVELIVHRAAGAAPAYSARIAAEAAHAFPAFAPRIAAAASTATPEQAAIIVQMTSEPRVAASKSEVMSAVESTLALQDLEPSAWKARIALGVAATPEYLGAETYEPRFAPLVDVVWRKRIFLRADGDLSSQVTGIGPTGLGWNFVRTPNWAVGTRATLDNGRDNDLDRLLTGTRTIDPDLELGLFFEYYGGPWNLGGDVRQGAGIASNSHGGALAELHLGYATRLSRRERFYLGLSSTLAGPAYMRTYFNRAGFRADWGLRDVTAYFTVEHDLSQRIFARLVTRVQRLLFDAARSPVSDANSNTQFYAAAQLGYAF